MVNATPIGRVGIKVIPDTSKFRKELQAKLKKIERGLEIRVAAVLDFDNVEVREQAMQVRETVERELDSITGKVRMRVNNAQFRADLARIRQQIARINFPINVDVDAAREKLERLKLLELELSRKITLSMDEAERDKLARQLRDVRRQIDNIADDRTVQFNPNIGNVQARRTKTGLDILSRRRYVEIVPRLSKLAAARVAAQIKAFLGGNIVKDMAHDLNEFFRNIDKNVVKMGKMIFLFASLASMIGLAAGNVIEFVGGLVSIAPAALALPGILGGFLAMIPVIIKGFKLLKNELKPLTNDISNAIDKSLNATGLKAAARDFVKQVGPIFTEGFSRISKQTGNFMANLFRDLTGPFKKDLLGMFDSLSRALSVLSSHTKSFANIITIMGKAGASYLPRLATGFGNAADKFSKWLSNADKTGRLKRMIDDAVTSLKNLWDGLKGISSGLYGLFQSVTSGGLQATGAFKHFGEVVRDIFQNPAVQDAIRTFVQAASGALDIVKTIAGAPLAKALDSVFRMLAGFLPTIAAAVGNVLAVLANLLSSNSFFKGMDKFLKGLSDGLAGLLPGIAALAVIFEPLGDFLGTLARNIGNIVGELLKIVAPIAAAILQILNPIADALGRGLIGMLRTVGPTIVRFVQSLADSLTSNKDLFEEFLDAITGLFLSLADGLNTLLEAWLAMPKDERDFLIGVQIGSNLFTWKLLGAAIQSTLYTLAAWIDVFSFLWKVASFWWTDFRDLGIKILAGISRAWSQFWTGFTSILKVGVDFVVKLWSALWTTVKSQFDVATASLRLVLGYFQGQWTAAWSIIGSAATIAFGAISAALSGIKTLFQPVLDALNGLKNNWKSVWDSLPAPLRIAVSGMLGALAVLAAGFNTVLSAINGVIAGIDRLNGKKVVNGAGSVAPGSLFISGKGILSGTHAKGGDPAVNKVSLVGELGPELFVPKVPGTVITAANTQRILQSLLYGGGVGKGGGDIHDNRQFNYHAAPNASLDSQEELFSAVSRARFVWG